MGAGCTVDNADFDPAVAWPAVQDGAGAIAAQPDGGPGQGPDLRANKSTPFSCTPGAFLSCHSTDVLNKCGVKGKGVEKVKCTYGCNATAGRCNQCDPSEPAYCAKDVVVTCSASGELSKETCKYGCDAAKCKGCPKTTFYRDIDADGYGNPLVSTLACEKPEGYASNALDCNDELMEVRPGQSAFFKDPIVGTKKGFDYNCDTKQELQYPVATLGSCARKGATCLGSGWLLLVPPCGGAGFYMECKPKGSKPKDGCKEVVVGGLQHCR